MQNLTQPTLLLKPFAESGDKNTLPSVNTDPSNPQRADLTNGFPQITSQTPDNGGLPPERKDFNGLGYLTTTYDYFYQAGGTFTYNATIASAIGGYPLGARLWYTDSNGVSCILRSTIQNNSNNFLNDSSVIGITGSGKPWEIESFRGIGLNTQYVTNCITEIPQDIKLELNSGTLTLKAGSKVYVPNGSGTFNTVTTTSDINIVSSSVNYSDTCLVAYNNGNTVVVRLSGTNQQGSGTVANRPAVSSMTYNSGLYYASDENKLYVGNKSANTWTAGCSFPIAIIKLTAGVGCSSVEQVFNGFGYIGNTVFALTGVKGLIPNGRNSDGTLRSTSFTISNPFTDTRTGSTTGTIYAVVNGGSFDFSSTYEESAIEPNYNSVRWYDTRENVMRWKNSSGELSTQSRTYLGEIEYVSSKVVSFNPKVVFHSADYYDLEQTNSNISTLDAQNVKLTGNQTIDGTKTFSSKITGSISGSCDGNAGTVTNGVYTTGNQTIAGNKTFSGSTTFSGSVSLGSSATLTAPATTDTSTKAINTQWIHDAASRIAHFGTINYSAGIGINNNTEYTCLNDGIVLASGVSNTSSTSTFVLNNNTILNSTHSTQGVTPAQFTVPVKKGDKVKVNFTNTKNYLAFYPFVLDN